MTAKSPNITQLRSTITATRHPGIIFSCIVMRTNCRRNTGVPQMVALPFKNLFLNRIILKHMNDVKRWTESRACQGTHSGRLFKKCYKVKGYCSIIRYSRKNTIRGISCKALMRILGINHSSFYYWKKHLADMRQERRLWKNVQLFMEYNWNIPLTDTSGWMPRFVLILVLSFLILMRINAVRLRE